MWNRHVVHAGDQSQTIIREMCITRIPDIVHLAKDARDRRRMKPFLKRPRQPKIQQHIYANKSARPKTRPYYGNDMAMAWQYGTDMAITWQFIWQSHGNDIAVTQQWQGNDIAMTWQWHGNDMAMTLQWLGIAIAMTEQWQGNDVALIWHCLLYTSDAADE